MKSTTTSLLKFAKLQRRLAIGRAQTVGTLELLWAATAKEAPEGDIGRHSDEDIAEMCDWSGDVDILIGALISTRWLDVDDRHRLVVHDWSDHCPNFVKGFLARHGRAFVIPAAKQPTQGTLPLYAAEAGCNEHPATKPSLAKPRKAKPGKGNTSTVWSRPRVEDKTVAAGLFDEFWAAYPARNGRKRGKQDVMIMFQKLAAIDQRDVVTAAKHYKEDQSEDFVRDPVRFLKNGYWKDFVARVKPRTRVATMDEAESLFKGDLKK